MDRIKKIENMAAGIFLILGVALSLFGVFMRYVMNSPVSWTTEVYTLFFVWSIFIGFGTALRDNTHISIEVLYDRLNQRSRAIADTIGFIVGVGFSLFLFITGIEMVVTTYIKGIVSTATGIPHWITYLVMPMGGLLLLYHYVLKIFFRIKNKDI